MGANAYQSRPIHVAATACFYGVQGVKVGGEKATQRCYYTQCIASNWPEDIFFPAAGTALEPTSQKKIWSAVGITTHGTGASTAEEALAYAALASYYIPNFTSSPSALHCLLLWNGKSANPDRDLPVTCLRGLLTPGLKNICIFKADSLTTVVTEDCKNKRVYVAFFLKRWGSTLDCSLPFRRIR